MQAGVEEPVKLAGRSLGFLMPVHYNPLMVCELPGRRPQRNEGDTEVDRGLGCGR